MTFVDLYDDGNLTALSHCALHLLTMKEAQGDSVPNDTEMVITLERPDSDSGNASNLKYIYGYYLATWERKRIFWLEDVEYEYVTDYTRVSLTESHIGEHKISVFRCPSVLKVGR